LRAAVAAAQAKVAAPGARQPAAHVQAALAPAAQQKASPPVPWPPLVAGPPSRAVQGFFSGGLSGVLQAVRQGGAVQAKLEGSAVRIPADLLSLHGRGGGQPMPDGVRRQMEAVFATDFSDVRIHVGREAEAIGAHAFTHGAQIHFAPGRYDPGSAAGLRLLAHELTHVVQQRAGRTGPSRGSGIAIVHDPRLEAEAERMAARSAAQPCVQAKRALPAVSRPRFVQAAFSIDNRHFDQSWVRYVLRDELPSLNDEDLKTASAQGNYKTTDDIKAFIVGRRPAAAVAAVAPVAEVKWEPRIVRREVGSSGEHHPILHFTFGADEKETKFDLDTWSNRKSQGRIRWLGAPADLKTTIRTWDFKRCLACDLIDQDLKLCTGNRDQAMLLMAVQESLATRLGDIRTNCPAQLTMEDAKGTAYPSINIEWIRVLITARELVKRALDAKTAVPDDHHGVTFADDAVFTCDDPGLTLLRDAKFVVRSGRGAALETRAVSYKPKGALRASGIKVKGPKKPSFNFGVGHLRYIVFLEWRVLKEMLDSLPP